MGGGRWELGGGRWAVGGGWWVVGGGWWVVSGVQCTLSVLLPPESITQRTRSHTAVQPGEVHVGARSVKRNARALGGLHVLNDGSIRQLRLAVRRFA